jgi:hypothetical protein
MFDKSIQTGDGGLLKISTRLVGAEERVLLTLSGKSGVYVVDANTLLTEGAVREIVDALNDALLSRRLSPPAEKK